MNENNETTANEEISAVEVTPDEGFEQFNLNKDILKSISWAGFKVPSPIQKQAIPLILDGKDMVGQAHTGTGKTAAFGLPLINKIKPNGGVQMLVITPTRELANQVSDELFKYGKNSGLRTVTIYGGSSYGRQLGLIEKGAQIVVATPGRLLDILKRDMLANFAPQSIVLDEADEMLDMGFLDDINEIFSYMPSERQTLLFSATMPMPIKKLAERILVEPEFITITKSETTNKNISQLYYVIDENERDDAIIRLLDAEETNKTVVFCRTKKEVDRLANVLSAVGYKAKGLHGDMEQRQRETTIRGLKTGATDILVATDVAARGIHIDDVSHVFNYHIPFDSESYVHRIGRTGRAGTSGKAITLLTPIEFKELQRIKQKVGATMEHAFVPSKNDVKQSTYATITDNIREQKVYDEAHMVLDALKDEFDQEQIMYKLASLVMDRQEIKGPNQIGIAPERLEKILESLAKRHSNGGNRRGGYRGNRNRSSGGYRGNRNRNGGGGSGNRSARPRS